MGVDIKDVQKLDHIPPPPPFILSKTTTTGLEIIKHFSCSTQLSMKSILLVNVKMPTIVGIFHLRAG